MLTGMVADVHDNTVTLCNYCHTPVSNRTERIRAVLVFDSDTPTRMRLQKGAFVVATALDNPSVARFMKGEENSRTIRLKGKTIRYTGAIDFDRYMNEKEQHVFVGSVVGVNHRIDKQSRPYAVLTVGWKSYGKDELRHIVSWKKTMPEVGKRIVVVAGEQLKTRSTTYYPEMGIETY